MTWPAAISFNNHFFCDTGDGYQNVWNLWWVRTAVLSGQNPWFTHMLHAPSGTTLIGHTLNPFNGFFGIPLAMLGLSLVQVHNVIVVGSFAMAGVTAFWLAMRVTCGHCLASLIGGFCFSFSSFHFAHAEGHLQLVSLEWIPLFLLSWIELLDRPRTLTAIASSVALTLVLLCDFYYFFFCVLSGAFLLAWRVSCRPVHSWRPLITALLVFTAASAFFCCPLVIALLRNDFTQSHPPGMFSTDLLSPIIPGAHWWAGGWTKSYWSLLPGNEHETNIYLGLSVLALSAWALLFARAGERRDRWMWATLGLLFFILSLGPALMLRGEPLTGEWLPYQWLVWLIPALKLGGMPIRMIVITTLAVAMLAAAGVATLQRSQQRNVGRWITAIACVLIVIDLKPRPMTLASEAVPAWVTALQHLPAGSIIDLTASPDDGGTQLYEQTVHHHPMAMGYIARVPTLVVEQDTAIQAALEQQDLNVLHDRFGFRYIICRTRPGLPPTAYQDADIAIVDLDTVLKR